MSLIMTNNAKSTIATNMTVGATNVIVASGDGSLFPAFTEAGQWTPLVLEKADGSACEIVRATDRVGDAMTIERAQEGTTAIVLEPGDRVYTSLTWAGLLDIRNNIAKQFAPNSVSSGAQAFSLTIDGVTAYEDEFVVQFLPHESAGDTLVNTLSINGLADIPIVKRDLPDGSGFTNAGLNDFIEGEPTTVVYDNGVFVLDDTPTPLLPNAAVGTSGIIELADTSEEEFDLNGDDTRAMTQAKVSELVNNHAQLEAVPEFPSPWLYYGSAVNGGVILNSGVTQRYNTGTDSEYGGFITLDGSVLTAETLLGTYFEGSYVIRARSSIQLDGLLVFPDAKSEPLEDYIVGPMGEQILTTAANAMSGSTPLIGSQGDGGPVTRTQVRNAIKQGVDFSKFRGGIGGGVWAFARVGADNYNPGMAGGQSGQQLKPGGTVILIAPTITLGPNFRAVMNSKRNQTDSQTADSAGGMLLCVTPNGQLTVDPLAQFAAGDDPASFQTAAQLLSDRQNNIKACDAANGQAFHVVNDTGNVLDIF